MANSNGWGDGAANNAIGWGQGANNAIGWGDIHADSWAGLTDIVGVTTDPDAQAFITAAAITNPTQQAAINTLVVDLKGYNIWTKMKAIYPFLGSTASQHKFNLKDPRDLDAAFRILWNGGVTHSANGVQFGGVNGYGDTKFIPSSALTLNSSHMSFYSRTTATGDTGIDDFGTYIGLTQAMRMMIKIQNTTDSLVDMNAVAQRIIGTVTTPSGFFLANRQNSTSLKYTRNTTSLGTNTNTNTGTLPTTVMGLGCLYNNSTGTFTNFSARQCAFASIGDGLTDTEAANFYTAVQAFQTTIGRSIGTQTVSDADAQAFITAADIQDQVEANAVNNLVIGLKADGLWTKMKAVYPFVGGTASAHKFNLKNPLDTDGAFRMTFHGGVTHSSNGITFATNGYADTKWLPSANSTTSNVSGGAYSRTNLTADYFLLGSLELNTFNGIAIAPKAFDNNTYFCANNWVADNPGNYVTDTRGLFHTNRDNLTVSRLYRNGISIRTSIPTLSFAPAYNVFLGARNYAGTAQLYFNGNLAFGFLGDTLTLTEAANLYTAVQNFNTALARQV